ncbi:hypothetical protein D3C80_16540 [compost metagenome]
MELNKNVLVLDPKAKYQKDLQNLMTSMKFMPWDIKVMSIASACGMPVSDLLLNQETPAGIGSLASNLGHKNIAEFIGDVEYGIGVEWDTWCNDVKAVSYRNTFGIYSNIPQEIIAEYADVVKVLGREPANGAEYHRAKDAVLMQRQQDIEAENKRVIGEMHTRIASMIITSDAERSLHHAEKERANRLEAELAIAIENSAKQVSAAISSSRIERDSALQAQKQSLEVQFSEQTYQLQKEARESIEKVNQQMDELRAIYNGDNFIPKQEYAVLLDEIDRERSQSRASQVKVVELTNELTRQKAMNTEQEQLVNAMSDQMESIKNSSTEAMPVVFQSLQSKITNLEGYIERFRDKNADLKEKLQIKTALCAQQKKELSKVKRNIGLMGKIMVGSLISATAIIAYLAVALS